MTPSTGPTTARVVDAATAGITRQHEFWGDDLIRDYDATRTALLEVVHSLAWEDHECACADHERARELWRRLTGAQS